MVVNYKEIMLVWFLIIYIFDMLFFVLKFIFIKRGSFYDDMYEKIYGKCREIIIS